MTQNALESLEKLQIAIAEEITALGKSERVNELLAFSFGRVLTNAYKRGKLTEDEYDVACIHLVHIADWIHAAVVNNAEWLQKSDKYGRPKKLLKFADYGQIVDEANKDIEKFAQKNKNVVINEGDEEFIMMLDEGYYVVRLLTPTALDRESAFMQHCIGQGAYDDNLQEDGYEYYSLRDPSGKPHITMEVDKEDEDTHQLLQFQGKQNKPPLEKYVKLTLPFLMSDHVQILEATNVIPYIRDNFGDWHHITHLPETLYINELRIKFMLSETDNYRTSVLKLPKNLIGTSLLSLDSVKAKLPETYSDHMDFHLFDCTIIDPPKQLITNGDITIEDSESTEKIDIIQARNVHFLEGCYYFFPNEIVAKEKAVIRTALPETPLKLRAPSGYFVLPRIIRSEKTVHDIVIDDVATFLGSKIRILPRGLNVGALNLYSTDIEIIPDQTKVKHYIDAIFCPIMEISENLPDDLNIRYVDTIGVTLKEFRKVISKDDRTEDKTLRM